MNLLQFAGRRRIYKIGGPANRVYVAVSGKERVSTVDEDKQEVVMEKAVNGEFFGLACIEEQTAHQTSAMAVD